MSDVLASPLEVTFFAGPGAQTARRETTTLRDLAGLINRTAASTKAELPWLKLATFGDQRTAKGSLRHNANMQDVWGVELDYDDTAVSPAQAAERLRAAGLAALVYTSPSHTLEAPKWRVLAPLSQRHPPDARQALAGRLNAAIGGIAAGESFTASQAFYYGETPAGDDHHTILIEGKPLDDCTLEPVYPARKTAESIPLPPQSADQATKDYAASVLARACAEFAGIEVEGRRHHVLLSVTLMVAPFVLGGFLDFEEAGDAITAALGRPANDGEIEGALQWALRMAQPYFPPTGGAEFCGPPAPVSKLVRRFVFPADCATSALRGYLIKHLLAPGDVGALIGPPSAGKSVLAPHIAYAVAQGRPAFGLRTKPGRVLYAAAEDVAGMRQRLRALFDRHGDAPDFALVDIGNLRDGAATADLLAAVAEWTPALLVIDTLGAAWAGLDENSSVDMGGVVAVARSIAATGCAVLLVHHVAKHGDGTPRGHSALNGTLDVCLALGDRGADGVIRAKLQKNRNGTPDRDIAFRILVAELGRDEDGDSITAPVAAEVMAERSSAPKLNRQQTVAWGEFLKIETQTRADPAGIRHVSMQEWKENCGLVALSASSNRDSQRTTFNRACGDLVRLGLVAKTDIYAWRINTGVPIETFETSRYATETGSTANRDGRDGQSRDARHVSVPGSEFIN